MDAQARASWHHRYATTALRLDRLLHTTSDGTLLIFNGPEHWRAEVAAEDVAAPGQVIEACHALRESPPFPSAHDRRFVTAHLHAMEAVARRAGGEDLPLTELATRCFGVAVTPQEESVFEGAHAKLDAALPTGRSLIDRLRVWQTRHSLPRGHSRLPQLAAMAIDETRRRTEADIPFPPDAVIDVVLDPGPHRGRYDSGRRATMFLHDGAPFNLADLVYVIAHEGCPGHIAESMLKQIHLIEERGKLEQHVRFLISPAFVLSEGLGLHAPEVAFPDDTAQAWLTEKVLGPLGIRPDGSDFAAIHDARNMLWGAWANAAILRDRGATDAHVMRYLQRWALLSEAEAAWAVRFLATPGMDTYVLSYDHGWRLVGRWLDGPDRMRRVRRLLTEPLVPADLA